MKKFKLLPHYYEEIPDKLRSPDSEYYLGEAILSRYPRIKDHIGTLGKKEMEILVKYMEKGSNLNFFIVWTAPTILKIIYLN